MVDLTADTDMVVTTIRGTQVGDMEDMDIMVATEDIHPTTVAHTGMDTATDTGIVTMPQDITTEELTTDTITDTQGLPRQTMEAQRDPPMLIPDTEAVQVQPDHLMEFHVHPRLYEIQGILLVLLV